MNREKLVEKASEWLDENNYRESDFDFREMIIDRLADFALSVSGWTAVSEKLPDKSGWYLVTRDSGKVDIGHIDLNYRGKQLARKNFLAWHPLPEPYEPQEAKV
jgi:hypothetical protein